MIVGVHKRFEDDGRVSNRIRDDKGVWKSIA